MELLVMSLRVFWSFAFHPILLLFMSLSGSESVIVGTEMDRLSLVEFKNRITNDPLGILSSWNHSYHFCEWQGVTCGRRNQRITALDLEGQNLVGTIAPHIGNLSFLRFINLRNNSFHGKIPEEVGRLFRLRDISLNNNSFGGEIPANLSYCSNLLGLHLSYNNLGGQLPVEIGSLSKLQTVDIDNNHLTGGIPPSLGNISSLKQISLSSNNLEGSIPDVLDQMISLTFFAVGENKFSGMIPPSFYNLSSVKFISLSTNDLYGSLRPDIGIVLPNLQQLDIGANQFTGPIPVSLSNASGLRVLDIPLNNFTGKVPLSLGDLQGLQWLNIAANHLGSVEADDLSFLISLINCSNLRTLAFGNNHFGGMLPNSIANLSTQLTILRLGGNQIVGRIPVGIENIVNLALLDMQTNLLTGGIPASIGKLPRLQELFLSENRLSGQIPSSLGNITQLIMLDLHNNSLEGSIPSSLGNCQHLLAVYLCHNKLNGTIPQEVFGLSFLSISFNVSHNSLTGSLPVEVGNLKSLGGLDVSHNKLSGEIPSTLGNCLSLEHLYMQDNFFQGTIPSSLSYLKAIQDLDLSQNNLSGQIPKYMENFPFLQNLNLSFNDLKGEVPKEGVFRNASVISVYGNKKLCGGITELQLHACPMHGSKKQGRSLAFRLIIIMVVFVVLCLILILSLLILYWIRKSRKNHSSTPSIGDRYLKVSYKGLFEATCGFSSGNLVGVGSFGSVYKGILGQDETTVAVKVLNLQQVGASKSFMAECEALRNIRHRNLIKIITSCSSVDFEGNDFKALVFEFMPNGNLEKWLHPDEYGQNQSQNLNLLQRLNIAIDVASVLHYLHQHCQIPIVHCDLKPSNILLDNDMSARVSDFGLARLVAVSTNKFPLNQSSSVGVKGSIGYAAPEYGMGGEVSTCGDVYSYGILLLEMFTGRKPIDEMFKDDLNLHNFAKMAMLIRAMEIVDPLLLPKEEEVEEATKIKECLTCVLQIGVACSMESPRQRMDMREVVKELHFVRDIFLGVGIHGERQTKAQLVGKDTSLT